MLRSPRHWLAAIYVLVALILAGCNTTPPEPPGLVPTSAPVAQPASTAAAPTSPSAPTAAPTSPAPTDAPIAATAAPEAPATSAPPASAGFSPPTATPALSNQLINPDTLANLRPLRTIGYGRAQAAAIGPGNMLLAVGTTAGVAWFELPSLRALRFDQIPGGVDSLAFQFGDQLFAAGPGGQQRMRVATGEILPPDQEELNWLGGDNPVFSPDGALVATSLGDRQSALWSVAEQKLLRNLDGTAPIFSPDGQLIATAMDGRSTLWRAGDGQELLSVDGTQPAFSPDGNVLRTAGESEVRLWHLPDGAAIGKLDAVEAGWQAEFSADSRELRVLLQVGAASSLKVVDVANGQLLRDITLVEEQEVFGLPMNSVLGPYGTLAVAVGYNGRVTRAGDAEIVFTSAENDYTIYQLAAFSEDGELAALLNADGRVYLVSAGEQPVQTLDLEGISSIAISPDGSLLATGSDNPRIWQLIDGALTQTLKLNINGSWWEGGAQIGALAFSPDGSTLVIESDGGEAATSFRAVEGWPIASGGAGASSWQLEVIHGPATEQTVVQWRFSAAARALAWMNDVGGITLRASDSMTVTLSEASGARIMGFSPDGSLLAVGDKAGQVALFSTADGAPSAALQAGGPVGDLMFSPDGTLLGARQDDGTLTVWRVGEQAPLVTLETDPFTMNDDNLFSGQDEPSDRFIFSADKQLLITSGVGGVIFYRLGDGQRLHDLPVAARDMAIGPGGRLLAVAQTDGRVTLWGVP